MGAQRARRARSGERAHEHRCWRAAERAAATRERGETRSPPPRGRGADVRYGVDHAWSAEMMARRRRGGSRINIENSAGGARTAIATDKLASGSAAASPLSLAPPLPPPLAPRRPRRASSPLLPAASHLLPALAAARCTHAPLLPAALTASSPQRAPLHLPARRCRLCGRIAATNAALARSRAAAAAHSWPSSP